MTEHAPSAAAWNERVGRTLATYHGLLAQQAAAAEAPEDRAETTGYCYDCGEHGWGRFDEVRTAHTDWIVDHVGCPGPAGG